VECPRCGLPEGEMRDGYLSAAEVETLFEEVPPEVLRHLVRSILEHRAEGRTGGGGIRFDGSRGEIQDWHLLGTLNQRVGPRRLKRA
jgi:hypothetical protein